MKDYTASRACSTDDHVLGERAYIALTTLWVAAGLGLTTLGAAVTYGMNPGWGLILGAFLVSVIGIGWVHAAQPNTLVASLGYALIAFPMGAMVGPLAAQKHAHLVNVVGTTLILSIGLGGLGVLIPKSLKSWGSYLMGGLIALIVAQFSTILLSALGLPVAAAFTVLDWVGIVLFSFYIVYDMNQALRKTRTYYNCLDSAVDLHLSIINLFIRLLSSSKD